jgi:hypothetical protein
MKRPRSNYRDCAVAVFCEITGENKDAAIFRFLKGNHLDGRPGLTINKSPIIVSRRGRVENG